jgi:serine protease Do
MTRLLKIAALALVTVTIGTPGSAQAQNRPAERGFFLGLQGATIGASIRDVRTADLAAAKLSQPDGVFIESVQPGAPADRGGLRSGDIVMEYDGEHVRGARHFARLVQETPSGRTVKVVVSRGGATQSLTITPAEGQLADGTDLGELRDRIRRGLEQMPGMIDLGIARGPARRLGVEIVPLSTQLAQYFGVTAGVLVSQVEADSPAAHADMRSGDVITAINGQQVVTPADVIARLRAAENSATVDVTLVREKKEVRVQAKLGEPRSQRRRGAAGI